MELQLGLALPSSAAADHDHASNGCHGIDLDLNVGIDCGPEIIQQYRQFRNDLEGRVPDDRTRQTVPRTLPLLHLAGREGNGYDEGDDEDEYMDTDSSSFHQLNRGGTTTTTTKRRLLGCNSNYVKVAMEGIGIGRKVNLSLHNSFDALKNTLLPMFGIYNEDSDNYKLSYQNRGGHWVIAEESDSSWRNFIRSAQRLKLVKI